MENTRALQCAQGKKVLIVEDEETIRRVCGAMLRQHGFEYILATNGAEGLAAYRERRDEICLVLSDVSMPVMSGLEMVRNILEIHSHPNVILMSGYYIATVVPKDLKKLCSVIQKPFTALGLVASVRECLKYDEDQMAKTAERRTPHCPFNLVTQHLPHDPRHSRFREPALFDRSSPRRGGRLQPVAVSPRR